MGKKINLIGQRFGRLTVIAELGKRKQHIQWECSCDCGVGTRASTTALRQGKRVSCGCLKREKTVERNWKHGLSETREYKIWAGIKKRCTNPNTASYNRYGGRGIEMCERWFNSFENFLSDMGQSPLGLSIERKDSDGGYNPQNCVWASRKQQANNTSQNIRVEHKGEIKTLAEWASYYGFNYPIFHYLFRHRGKTIDEIIALECKISSPKTKQRDVSGKFSNIYY